MRGLLEGSSVTRPWHKMLLNVKKTATFPWIIEEKRSNIVEFPFVNPSGRVTLL